MKNWKNYVSFQQMTDWFWYKPTKFNLFYLKVKTEGEGKVAIPIEREKVSSTQFVYNENSIGDVVESLLYTFPKWEVESDWNDPEKNYKKYTIARINTEIARNSRRGVGNIEFESDKGTVFYYKGSSELSSQFDCPILVFQYYTNEGSKGFVVKKHPDFDNYGFVVEKK